MKRNQVPVDRIVDEAVKRHLSGGVDLDRIVAGLAKRSGYTVTREFATALHRKAEDRVRERTRQIDNPF